MRNKKITVLLYKGLFVTFVENNDKEGMTQS